MSKKIQDEMVHHDMCYWSDASRSWTPYTKQQLTEAYFRALGEIANLKNLVKSREASIIGNRAEIEIQNKRIERMLDSLHAEGLNEPSGKIDEN